MPTALGVAEASSRAAVRGLVGRATGSAPRREEIVATGAHGVACDVQENGRSHQPRWPDEPRRGDPLGPRLLPMGSRMQIVGHEERPELNGLVAVPIDWDAKSSLYIVSVKENGSWHDISVRARNVAALGSVVSQPTPSPNAAAAPSNPPPAPAPANAAVPKKVHSRSPTALARRAAKRQKRGDNVHSEGGKGGSRESWAHVANVAAAAFRRGKEAHAAAARDARRAKVHGKKQVRAKRKAQARMARKRQAAGLAANA